MDYLGTGGGGSQFNDVEDPSDDAAQLQLKATIEAILENTLDDNEDQTESQQTSTEKLSTRLEQKDNSSASVSSSGLISNCADATSTLQNLNEDPSTKESEKISELSEFDKLLVTVQKEFLCSSSPSKYSESNLPAAVQVSGSKGLKDDDPSEGKRTVVSSKHSPRKSKDKTFPNRDTEVKPKAKEWLDNELQTLPLKKRGRVVRSKSRSQKQPGSTSTFPPKATEAASSSHSRRPAQPVSTSCTERSSSSTSSLHSQFNMDVPSTEKINSDVSGNDDIDFFLPDGWLYYAVKRMVGINLGKFDQYYLTPAPRRDKLRSRQDLLAWMKKHGKNWDVNDFFCRQNFVEPLIKKGVLKHISDRYVVAASSEKDFFAEGRHLLLEKGLLSKMKGKEKSHKANVKSKTVPLKKLPPPKPQQVIRRSGLSTRHSTPIIASDDVQSLTSEDIFEEEKLPIASQPSICESPVCPTDSEEDRVQIRKKPKIFKSPYFSLNDGLPEKPLSLAALCRDRNDKDAPPRSPFNLIQEDLFHNPWQLLVSTIFLNCTSGKLAIPLATEFLSRWPTPQEVCRANIHDILDVVEPLGFGRTRAAQLIRFSHEFLTKIWKYPKELYGIGKYGNDSYKIFCLRNEWKKVDTDDPLLMMYLNWRRATEHLRKQFSRSPGNPMDKDPDDIAIPSEGGNMKVLELLKKSDSPQRNGSPVKRRGRPPKNKDSKHSRKF